MDVLLQELFGTSVGLLSLFTIGFVVVMAVYIYRFVRRKVAEDTQAARQREQLVH